MTLLFEELDSQSSPIGEISLRRRRIPLLGERDIYEVKLGDEFLMSSAFVDGEEALARLALAALGGDRLRIVVGGLGLGYTARAVLACDRVAELYVVEALDTVIGWHRQGLVPVGRELNRDSRCRYVHGAFFELAMDPARGFGAGLARESVDAILLDIDHSPRALLNSANAAFYCALGLHGMVGYLRPGGIFAMWSNEAEDGEFMELLSSVFSSVESHRVEFDNPFQGGRAFNTIYLARL